MKKKIAVVLTSLLILTLLFTTPHFALPVTAPDGPCHWKIELAQKKCNAYIFGFLMNVTGAPIPGTEFELNCTCEEDDPQPHSQRVYWKVATDVIPTGINFIKYVDWNKDGIWDEIDEVFGDLVEPEEGHRWYHHQQERNLTLYPLAPVNLSDPVCSEWEGVPNMPPFAGLWHLSSWHDSGWPYGELSYCDEVDLTPLDVPGPVDWWHVKKVVLPGPVLLLDQMVVVEVHQTARAQWRITMKIMPQGLPLPTTLKGNLTKDNATLPGTNFNLVGTTECHQVVRTPNCTVPNDIYAELLINDMPPPVIIDEPIIQFPWTYVYVVVPGIWNVTLELTEVQTHLQWQITMKTHGLPLPTTLKGNLTKDNVTLPGTNFNLVGTTDPDLQCQVVRTPNCTVPNDIYAELLINDMPPPVIIDEPIIQFPWTYVYAVGPGANVTLELTEVQTHSYRVMRGSIKWCMHIGEFPPVLNWTRPFRTRLPYLMPLRYCQNITFTQKDPITGIIKLGVPAESFEGLAHWYWDPMGAWFKIEISLEEQGCGWLFTHEGKEPIYGCVDLLTYNNYSGVYTYGLDQLDHTADDELLAGPVSGNEAAGAGPPLGPCLQNLRGPDDIPGTGDDPIGRGDPDGSDPPGSSLLYLPCTLTATVFAPGGPPIVTKTPFPLLMTTEAALDSVMEPGSELNGVWSDEVGEPWEFIAGLDHPGWEVAWKHSKCNAYVTYACAWSVFNISTFFGPMDIMYEVCEKKVREDVVIADITCNELVDVVDLTIASLGLWGEDEGPGPDGTPNTGDDKPDADTNYDFGAQADIADPRGLIDIVDLTVISLELWEDITPYW